MHFAPIVVFAYNRPTHLANLLDSLIANPEAKKSKIFIFIDGPKNSKDYPKVQSVSEIASSFKSRLDIEINMSSKNLGLSQSIRTHLDGLFAYQDELIVLEDDLVVSPKFLDYMNKALRHFHNRKDISCVSGFTYPIPYQGDEGYLIRGGDCWGWATWKSNWFEITWDSNVLLQSIVDRDLRKEFDLGGSYDYSGMLVDSSLGLVDSWAIYWHASMFLRGKSTYYPAEPLVINEGADGSGTHYSKTDSGSIFRQVLSLKYTFHQSAPLINREAELAQFYEGQKKSLFLEYRYQIWRSCRRIASRMKINIRKITFSQDT